MKRALLAVICVLPAVLMTTQAHAGKYSVTGLKYGDSASEHCWVLPEVTGYDVVANLYSTLDAVRKRQDMVAQTNAERARANKAVEVEIAKLNNQLTAKSHALTAAKGDDAKAELQKAVDDLKSQIQQKKATLQPLIRLIDPVSFNKHADANKYIDELQKEAQTAKEMAAKKEAEKEAKSKKD